jgi:HSP20 family protein
MFFTPVIRRSAYNPAYNPAFRSVNRLLGEALLAPAGTAQAASAGVEQDETSYTLSFDVPGIAKDQLSIGIEGSIVRLESKAGAARQYKAAYELPQDIDVGASDARLENGVLTLKLTKKVPVSKVTELAIN